VPSTTTSPRAEAPGTSQLVVLGDVFQVPQGVVSVVSWLKSETRGVVSVVVALARSPKIIPPPPKARVEMQQHDSSVATTITTIATIF